MQPVDVLESWAPDACTLSFTSYCLYSACVPIDLAEFTVLLNPLELEVLSKVKCWHQIKMFTKFRYVSYPSYAPQFTIFITIVKKKVRLGFTALNPNGEIGKIKQYTNINHIFLAQ